MKRSKARRQATPEVAAKRDVSKCYYCEGTGMDTLGLFATGKCPVCEWKKMVSVRVFYETCEACEGTGWDPLGLSATAKCPVCRGERMVRAKEPHGTCAAPEGMGRHHGASSGPHHGKGQPAQEHCPSSIERSRPYRFARGTGLDKAPAVMSRTKRRPKLSRSQRFPFGSGLCGVADIASWYLYWRHQFWRRRRHRYWRPIASAAS